MKWIKQQDDVHEWIINFACPARLKKWPWRRSDHQWRFDLMSIIRILLNKLINEHRINTLYLIYTFNLQG